METLKDAFYGKFPQCGAIVQYFESANKVEFAWENLTKIRLQKFVTYMEERLSPNAVKTYCSKVKSVLTMYNEEVSLPKDYEKVLNRRRDASQHIYLNDGEIRQIIQYAPKTKAENIIKNWFLIGCLTGARHSDYIRFTSENIHDNTLCYVSVKTHTNTNVPLSPYVHKLIKENCDLGYNGVRYSDVYFNRILRRICRGANINERVSLYTAGKFVSGEKWEFVASHCARRSFATNLYKVGVDIYTISKLCGHSSVEMTKQYICCAPQVSESAQNYFNSYK